MNKIKKFSRKIFIYVASIGLFDHISDEMYLKLMYRVMVGKKLNLTNPQIFEEKIQFLKLNKQNSEYIKMVDKYEVKKYVASQIGEEYIIPVLGVWENFDDIEFNSLPNKFVIKCTHDSGGVVICKNKEKIDRKKIKRKINKSLKRNYYFLGREWPYKEVKPRIIVEKYLEDNESKELSDYKFHCFNGEPFHCQVFTLRNSKSKTTSNFYDMDWNHQKYSRTLEGEYDSSSHVIVNAPKNFDKMKEFAVKLSQNIPYVRIDFYEANEKLYFGEITFFPASGFNLLKPEKWEIIWGNKIDLT